MGSSPRKEISLGLKFLESQGQGINLLILEGNHGCQRNIQEAKNLVSDWRWKVN